VDHVVHPPVPGAGEPVPDDLPGGGFVGAVPERCSSSTPYGKGTSGGDRLRRPATTRSDEDKPETLQGLHQNGTRTVDLLEEGDPDDGLELPGADLSDLSLGYRCCPSRRTSSPA
jgi:hypothetical protein